MKCFAKFVCSPQLAPISFVHRMDQSLMSQESSVCASQDANYSKEDATRAYNPMGLYLYEMC